MSDVRSWTEFIWIQWW